MPYGGAEVTRQQLPHLIEQSERHNIDVRIVPTGVGGSQARGTHCCTRTGRCRNSTPYSWTPRTALTSPVRRRNSPSTVPTWTGWTALRWTRQPRATGPQRRPRTLKESR
ncbi:Scr1 family TA system antitoxin-like transcriptional regulator [Streptomyces sp. WG7]|uniref:Scr1 family TA system antitoxin-like transcriptional regulator n=1 Tax=Streptomyces sp. WG7 TaxID=3417650 RepID=UPI003CF8C250